MDIPQSVKRKYTKRKGSESTQIDTCLENKEKDTVKTHISSDAKKILEKWMYDHRFYCYPMKDEKQLLALETGLTIEKVSNWFINSRRRLLPKMLKNEGKSSDNFTISRKKGAKHKTAVTDNDLQQSYSSSECEAAFETPQIVDDGYADYEPNLYTIPETSMEYCEYEEVFVPVINEPIKDDNAFDVEFDVKLPIEVTRGILYDEATQQKCLFLITY